MKKIVIAMDSFKGCLTSTQANEAAEAGVHDVFPDAKIIKISVSDGGEGLLGAVKEMIHSIEMTVPSHDPLMRPIKGIYAISEDRKTAFIELASVSGLPLLIETERNPWITTTFGTGELIFDALERGCRQFIIGIGGSATNDAGLGLLQAVGFNFLDDKGRVLGQGGNILEKVAKVDFSKVHLAVKESRFIVACDVKSPFYGKLGAAYVFGPQKGADEVMIKRLDKGLQSFSKIIADVTRRDIARLPGAGAAGGTGGGLYAFLDAELKSGINLLLDLVHFDKLIKNVDLIITGEGSVDRQTLMGKVPSGILERAIKANVPTVLLAGKVKDEKSLLKAGFSRILCINSPNLTRAQMMLPVVAEKNIRLTTSWLIQNFN